MKREDIKLSENLIEVAREIDARLKEIAGERVGFSLIVFSDNNVLTQTHYISNADRKEASIALSEILGQWASVESQDIPAHLKN